MCGGGRSSPCHGPSRRAIEAGTGLNFVFAAAAAALLAALLWSAAARARRARAEAIATLFRDISPLLANASFENRGPSAYPRLVGRFEGELVQVTPVIDTLATRRLPALWMQVTLQCRLPVSSKFDMMMRAAGATTFSNFDLLPYVLELPAGFPEQAAARSDQSQAPIDPKILLPHIAIFGHPKAKELLITANGLRIVWLAAEADRLRYGVFRQADFGEANMTRAELQRILTTLTAIRDAITANA
jgi:hypothetical protein